MASEYISSDLPKLNYRQNDLLSYQSHNDAKQYKKFENISIIHKQFQKHIHVYYFNLINLKNQIISKVAFFP